MLPAFRLGLGGPVAAGRQFISWIHRDDVIGMMLAAIEDERWSGPVNATAPEPVCNREFSQALGHALGRPALLPVPALALRLLYGDMAEIVTTGARAVPAKALVLGYEFSHPQLEPALRAALAQVRRRGRSGRRRDAPRARRRFSVSMITRQGRLASKYAAVGPIRCSPAGAWMVDQ